MKKTTYILFASLVAAAIAAFFMPVILFRAEKGESVTLARSGKTSVTSVASFNTLVIKTDCDFTVEPSNNYEVNSLCVVIVESDFVNSPRIEMDSSWKGNVTMQNEDGVLLLSLDMEKAMKSCLDKNSDVTPYVTIAADNNWVATLTVPRGMLKEMESGAVDLKLKDFSKADLSINGLCGFAIEGTNCTFSSLKIQGGCGSGFEASDCTFRSFTIS